MSDDKEDKTEEPSGKRLAEARKKGQIARSREFNTTVMLLMSAVLLLKFGAGIGEGLLNIMHYNFALSREAILDPATLLIFLKRSCLDAALLIAPVIGGLCLAVFLGPIALGGWNFSTEALSPKFSKLNPLQGLPKLFGMNGVVELFKALMKVTLVGVAAYLLFKHYLPEFVGLNHEPVGKAVEHAMTIMAQAFLILSATLGLVALFDAPYQLWKHHESLKMSKQELRDEAKESDGNPEVKQKIRQRQMEMSQGRMMAAVPNADVVVTNPTHFSVALKYDPGAGGAPKVVAKGTDLIAAQIRKLATDANVPLLASPPLARALYYSTELDQEIPKGLFLAVAQVLAYIFSLKTAQSLGQKPPSPPVDITIPPEFKHD